MHLRLIHEHIRDSHIHKFVPHFETSLQVHPSTALSKSQSSMTIAGAWPPSSSEIFFTVSAAPLHEALPTSVDPVNVSFRTRVSSSHVSPIAFESPVTTLMTPFGIPACSAS